MRRRAKRVTGRKLFQHCGFVRQRVRSGDPTVRSVGRPLLQRIVRGLHTAMLICFHPDLSTLGGIPDSSVWDWEYSSSNKDLDKILLSVLQDIFAAFVNTRMRIGLSTTSSLAICCLQVLDDQPEPYSLKFHTALCYFIVLMWRMTLRRPKRDPRSLALSSHPPNPTKDTTAPNRTMQRC